MLLRLRSGVSNLSAPSFIKNHDVDTLLTLDEYRTIRDDSYGFCICLHFDLLRWRRVGICASRLAPSTNDDERALRHVTPNGPTDSQLNVRPRPTGLLDLAPACERHLGSHDNRWYRT